MRKHQLRKTLRIGNRIRNGRSRLRSTFLRTALTNPDARRWPNRFVCSTASIHRRRRRNAIKEFQLIQADRQNLLNDWIDARQRFPGIMFDRPCKSSRFFTTPLTICSAMPDRAGRAAPSGFFWRTRSASIPEAVFCPEE